MPQQSFVALHRAVTGRERQKGSAALRGNKGIHLCVWNHVQYNRITPPEGVPESPLPCLCPGLTSCSALVQSCVAHRANLRLLLVWDSGWVPLVRHTPPRRPSGKSPPDWVETSPGLG